MNAVLRLSIAALVAYGMGAAAAHAEHADTYEFVVHGCMPYNFPADHQRYLNLIDSVNALRPAFTVHMGDTKSGQTPCSDEAFDAIYAYFQRFEHPLVYSVGDNEWTDCHRPACGEYDPIERLARIREQFFPVGMSLGAQPMALESQRTDPVHGLHVENTRWVLGGVVFAAVHVVGSNNNQRAEDSAALAEYEARDLANEAWMRETFDRAHETGSLAVALFIQANPFDARGEARSPGFERFVRVLREETMRLARPVVLFHADSHYFRIDKPLRAPGAPHIIEHFTRVESFGAENMHAVRIQVNPANPSAPFTFREHIVEGNRRVPVQIPAAAAAQ